MTNADKQMQRRNHPNGMLEFGSADKPALILLHGLGGSAEAWAALLPTLTQRFRVFALTLPGHANGPKVPSLRLDGLAAQVLLTMDELGLEQAHLAGVSLGASIAIEAARADAGSKKAQRVLSVTAIAPGVVVERKQLSGANDNIRALLRLGSQNKAELARLAQDANVRRLALLLITQHGDQLRAAEFVAFIGGLLALPGTTLDELLYVPEQPFKPFTARCPITLLWGEADSLLPYANNAETARKNLPGAKLVPLPGCGHSTPIDDPVGTANAIVQASGVKP